MAAGPVSRLGSFEPGDKTGLQLSPHLAPSTRKIDSRNRLILPNPAHNKLLAGFAIMGMAFARVLYGPKACYITSGSGAKRI